jgi:hypothetical protein
MADQTETELAAAKTLELPAVNFLPQQDDGQFRAEQERIKQMIAANAPLGEILSNLVLRSRPGRQR